jgi:hypothetical protein
LKPYSTLSKLSNTTIKMYAATGDMLVYMDAWSYPRWQEVTGIQRCPYTTDPAMQSLVKAIRNCTSRDAVATLVASRSSMDSSNRTERKKYLKLWSKIASDCMLANRVDRFLSEHAVDVPHVAKAKKVRVPANGRQFYDMHIAEFAEHLFGPEAYEENINCLKREVHETAAVILYHTWSRQIKTAKQIEKSFETIVKETSEIWNGRSTRGDIV